MGADPVLGADLGLCPAHRDGRAMVREGAVVVTPLPFAVDSPGPFDHDPEEEPERCPTCGAPVDPDG